MNEDLLKSNGNGSNISEELNKFSKNLEEEAEPGIKDSKNNQKDIAEYLIDKSVDVNAKDTRGYTVLMNAATDDNMPMVAMLLENMADPNITLPDGQSTLMFACQTGDLDLAKIIMEYSGDPEALANNGQTPLMYASDSGHLQIVKYLCQYFLL